MNLGAVGYVAEMKGWGSGGSTGRCRWMRWATCLFVVLAVAVFGQVAAAAHGSDPSVDDSVTGMVPRQAGVAFGIVDSVVPELSAKNGTDRALDVLDKYGDPYLRIGPGGVQGNLNSAEFYRSSDPSDTARVPARAGKVGAAPAWVTLSRDPAWAWFDSRVRSDIDVAPADVVVSHRRTVLATWSIPLRYAGNQARLDGQVVYAPSVGGALARLTSPLHPDPAITTALEPGQYPDLFVANSGSSPLTVLGEDGEPFARIDPTGVAVNVRSPVHAADLIARGKTPETMPNATAAPLWQHVSDQPSYDWLDPRTRYPGSTPGVTVLLAAQPSVLQHWQVPATLGGHPLHFDGVVEWLPSPDAQAVLASEGVFPPVAHRSASARLGRYAAAGVVALLLAGVAVVIRRRRRPRPAG